MNIRVLLDENMPHKLRAVLDGFDMHTVQYLGDGDLKNGELLAKAEADGFDVSRNANTGKLVEFVIH